MAHERPLADFVGENWGIETVRTAGSASHDGLLFHSATCRGAIAWNEEDYRKSTASGDFPVIVDIADAHLSADAKGECHPESGSVLGCFGAPVVTRDRRIGERTQNTRLRKAAGTGSSRPSSILSWSGSKAILEMGASAVGVQKHHEGAGSFSILGIDLQAADSRKTMQSVWDSLKISVNK